MDRKVARIFVFIYPTASFPYANAAVVCLSQ